MHELMDRIKDWQRRQAVLLSDIWWDKINDLVIIPYMKEKAEWLNKQAYEVVITPKMIDKAFGIEKKTLLEKIKERPKALSYEEIIEVCRTYFLENPNELKGNHE